MNKGSVLALAILLMFVVPLGFLTAQAQKADTEEVIHAKFASQELPGDFQVVWAEKFAEFMEKETDGKFLIDVYSQGMLGDNRDIVELCQIGTVDFAFTDYAWSSPFVSQSNILALHYVWPKDNFTEVLQWVVSNGKFMEMYEEKFRDVRLVPLSLLNEGWQWLTSKKPINSVEDLRGLKTRIMGSQMLNRDYLAYDMDPAPMPYGEIYGALQTGMIDAQLQPMFANYSMKFYEVTDYFVQMWAEPFIGIPLANKSFFDSLSQEYQDLIREFFVNAVVESGYWVEEKNGSYLETIKDERPNIKVVYFNDKQIGQLREKAEQIVYPDLPDLGGEDSEEMLEIILQDISDAISEVK